MSNFRKVHCSCCAQPLPWPYIEMTPRQRKIFDAIKTGTYNHSGRLAAALGLADSNVRATISQLNVKLKEVNVLIKKRPYRIVEISIIPHVLVSTENGPRQG